jgi:hypothetical protein
VILSVKPQVLNHVLPKLIKPPLMVGGSGSGAWLVMVSDIFVRILLGKLDMF